MEMLEAVNDTLDEARAIQELPFEMLTPEIWASIQETQAAVCDVLEIQKLTLQSTCKIYNNPSLYAHLTTVMLAPE